MEKHNPKEEKAIKDILQGIFILLLPLLLVYFLFFT